MTGNLPPDQGRAPHLYDEQLQRQQQEKLLAAGQRPLLFPGRGGMGAGQGVKAAAD